MWFSVLASVLVIHLDRWNTSNPWTDYSPVSVAWSVNVDEVLRYIKNRLLAP